MSVSNSYDNAVHERNSTEAIKHAQVLTELVKFAEGALLECEKYADEHGLDFTFEPAYGMGGTYHGKGTSEYDDQGDPYDWKNQSWGWYSSSASC